MIKEAKRTTEGYLDLDWWYSLSIEDRLEYNISYAEIKYHPRNNVEKKQDKLEVVISPELIDTNALSEDNSDRKVIFRPNTWNEYLGQEKIKKELQARIKGCKEYGVSFHHLLIDGKAGTGKTTLAYLLAKNLGLNFVETVATTIQSQQNLIDLLVKTNGGILFIDEIHMIKSKIANFILPILEDFQVNGKKIKPFTLITATTEKGILLKKFKPFVDRFKIQHTLEEYTQDELVKIIKQYHAKMYSQKEIKDDVFINIAKNCRNTPRIAIRYLESYIFMGCELKELFETFNIVKDGLTINDIKLMKYLQEFPQGIGLQAISSYLGTSEENYLYQYESYLLQQGYITRLNKGRALTENGKEFLKGV
jgi:Holliday junction DNA helicase RuvB